MAYEYVRAGYARVIGASLQNQSTTDTCAEPTQQSELESLESSLRQRNDDLGSLGARLTALADRVLGGIPQKEGAAAPTPVPNGKVAQLRALTDGLADRCGTIAHALERLERLA